MSLVTPACGYRENPGFAEKIPVSLDPGQKEQAHRKKGNGIPLKNQIAALLTRLALEEQNLPPTNKGCDVR